MQYVRSLGGSVSKTWNSINPATLSGAIDVIVVEQEDGSLACSPFHVRFGKFSLLRPFEKKVEFKVNNEKTNYSMKLGEGGEAFFVFETSDEIPESLQTSPVISPAASPQSLSSNPSTPPNNLQEPEFLDLNTDDVHLRRRSSALSQPSPALKESLRAHSDLSASILKSQLEPRHVSSGAATHPITLGHGYGSQGSEKSQVFPIKRSASEELLPLSAASAPTEKVATGSEDDLSRLPASPTVTGIATPVPTDRSVSPPPIAAHDAVNRAKSLSQKLSGSNIPTQITDAGDLMLDMTGFKTSEDEALRAEVVARKILAEELEGNYDIGSLIGADEHGNLWIYSSEEAKETAARKLEFRGLIPTISTSDAASDPGYQSDDEKTAVNPAREYKHHRAQSEGVPTLNTPGQTPAALSNTGDPNRNYAKTLRLTSDQLKALDLKAGPNPVSFSVNRATCQAFMHYWKHDVPIVISDIDGTITKSDALGHVLNMIGRDWTHIGVAKLYTDIVANGYNILYLTSRSVGQADTTRTYLNGVSQEGYKLPKGPVIMSPDRTIAALRREIYLRKPEVFKMACLRDISNLFEQKQSPFYAGFGNRLTDALSYRSVNIPSTRIFTINSNAEVSLDLLTLNTYKSSYVTMREVIDQFFPPVGLLVTGGAEEFTDFAYWRDAPSEIADISDSESEPSVTGRRGKSSIRSEDEASDGLNDEDGEDEMAQSYLSQESALEGGDLIDSVIESIDETSVAFRKSTDNDAGESLDSAIEANLVASTNDTTRTMSSSHPKQSHLDTSESEH